MRLTKENRLSVEKMGEIVMLWMSDRLWGSGKRRQVRERGGRIVGYVGLREEHCMRR